MPADRFASQSPKDCLRDTMIAYLTRKEILEIVNRLAKEIEIDYARKEIVLICPLKGSFLFAADLMRAMQLPQQIDFVQLASASKRGAIRILKDLEVNVEGKNVLIVEEIIDAGRKLSFLRDRVLAASPASVKIVTLLDKPARRELELKPDYVGVTIDDRYMVGYGMDTQELGRNYGDIYYFKQ
jgi:hypoxanthine phosphoribosyltransferase